MSLQAEKNAAPVIIPKNNNHLSLNKHTNYYGNS